MEAVDHEPYCVPLVSLSSQPVLPPTVYLAVFSEDILIRKPAMQPLSGEILLQHQQPSVSIVRSGALPVWSQDCAQMLLICFNSKYPRS